jgi:large conductance mechanosensitive channel
MWFLWPAPDGPQHEVACMFSEFKAFLTKSNALALAIGVIIGGALGAVVNSLVNDIIMPPIGLALGGVDFTGLKWVLQAESGVVDTADHVAEVAIRWGNFVQLVIVFIVVALVVFLIGKALIKEAPAAPAEPSDEVRLLTEIRDSLRKA